MAEQTFRSPGFFEQEIDLSARRAAPLGIPAGIVGTAEKGPAFVPVTLGSFADFENKFGTLNIDRFGPYAVREFLKSKNAVTYLRVLGAGANETSSQRTDTQLGGIVKNAGFIISGSTIGKDGLTGSLAGTHLGCVQFLVAQHLLVTTDGGELAGFPVFSDNDTFKTHVAADDAVNLVRGVLFTPTGTRFEIMDFNQSYTSTMTGSIAVVSTASSDKFFKLALSSSAGGLFANDESKLGVRIFTASLDPNSTRYLSKVLNTDPNRFQEEQHLLYLDFSVESELATVGASGAVPHCVGLYSGTVSTTDSGYMTTTPYLQLFGRFDARYQTPKTPMFISQPYGTSEYDLFNFETISDGEWGNTKYKISIANIRKSSDPTDTHGTFDVQVRNFNDSDLSPEILEYYPGCSLNPNSTNYIARKIGDKKVYYNFDATDITERRLVVSGKYPNVSSRVRVQMHDNVEMRKIPEDAVPFGFRGIPVLKTNNTLSDGTTLLTDKDNKTLGSLNPVRITEHRTGSYSLERSVVPPLPFRFKCTRGAVSSNPSYVGDVGSNERVDSRFYWGVKFERLPNTGTIDNSILNPNLGSELNPLITAYTKFQGIEKLDTLVTGTAKDYFNNNKFTLARVALYNQLSSGHITDVTGTARDHMLEAAYVRNGKPSASDYTVDDSVRSGRITMATLVHSTSAVFNRFQEFNKFSTIFYGGFDGLNILDRDNRYMTDRAASSDTGGKAGSTVAGGLGLGGTANGTLSGIGLKNNVVSSYRSAVDIMTDPMSANTNILAIPGMRDVFITDYALDGVKNYGMALFVMDTMNYDSDATRLFDDSTARTDPRESSEQFEARAIDNNYAATYFPDVYIQDPINRSVVKVPPSIAALGALAYNDKVAYPWFAPAGFNRGALETVSNVDVRLNAADRDTLYDARINPIAVFPTGGFVIFGQKTLQMAKSALDRVNVRRLLVEVKRQVVSVANRLLFEQNNSSTQARFVNQITPLLTLIQTQAGIEQFRIICDSTNNTQSDVDANKMNGRIIIVPTRSIEYISLDFIVTNSGVIFA